MAEKAEKAEKAPEKKPAAPAAEKKDGGKGAPAPAAAAPEGAAAKGKGGGLMSKTPVILGAVMIVEAIVLFAGMKFLGAGRRTPTPPT